MMLQPYEQHTHRQLAATIATIFVVAGAVVGADHYRSEHPATIAVRPTTSSTGSTPPISPGATNPSDTTPATLPSGYKDGSYSATSSYYVPNGSESIQVSLTLSSGTVTDVAVQNSENDFESQRYQEDFASSYKTYVVGQKIAALQLGTIAGASDTTAGFNAALSRIASQAQA